MNLNIVQILGGWLICRRGRLVLVITLSRTIWAPSQTQLRKHITTDEPVTNASPSCTLGYHHGFTDKRDHDGEDDVDKQGHEGVEVDLGEAGQQVADPVHLHEGIEDLISVYHREQGVDRLGY